MYTVIYKIQGIGLQRRIYCKIGLLQSIIEAPVLALSATVTKEVKRDIDRVLGLSNNTVLIATLPDRYNIHAYYRDSHKSNMNKHIFINIYI